MNGVSGRGVSSIHAAAAAIAAAMLGGCAYVGEPLPPALHIPKPVTGLTAKQVGARIEVRFALPQFTTEDLPLELGEVDLRVDSQPISAPMNTPGTIDVPLAAEWVGRTVAVTLRVSSIKGKWSEAAGPAPVAVTGALLPPRQAAAEAAPPGVRLRWEASSDDVRILKRPFPNANWEEAGRVPGKDGGWTDPGSRFDVEQTYLLETVREVASGEAVSERTGEIRITPVDTFAPAVPGGLTAVLGIGAIELAWDRPTDTDLAGFRVYRAEGDGPWERVGEQTAAASASDRTAKPGTLYRYAVTAVDRKGNESARSEAAAITSAP